jgi:hypothetical protein
MMPRAALVAGAGPGEAGIIAPSTGVLEAPTCRR